MGRKLFDRSSMRYFPLSERRSKVAIEKDHIDPDAYDPRLDQNSALLIEEAADRLKAAKAENASRICAFGAHTIKNGLGPVLSKLVEQGWLTHLATNGAAVIHDWEFSFIGQSSEDVRKNVQEGKFGTWAETGFYINLAIAVGAFEGLGYGESIGKMISNSALEIPLRGTLDHIIKSDRFSLDKRAAAADLLFEIEKLGVGSGKLAISHPYKKYSVQSVCYQNDVPFTAHPMFGHDIIYTHNANLGAAVGRTAEIDFLKFADSVSNLENGVYLSVGSAVMSPMIFEKAISMARNVKRQKGKTIRNCNLYVCDLQEPTWDWKKGEPPADNPAYYQRFMKSFSRMGCPVDYICVDNRDFLVGLYRKLNE